ncbi:MAG: DUF6282 family protein [Acidimicrobiia bacterium]
MGVDITGAIDLHCHYGPDAHLQRSVTAIGAAAQAREAGHAGVLLKSHSEPTAQLARVVAEAVDGIDVYGGVCCDHEVGGLNPAAVEVALALGGRIVWLPTLSSRQDVANGVAAQLGIPGPGLAVIDDDGSLLPEVREIADLCREHGVVLATGHTTAAEHIAVAREYGARQKVLVTHAMEELAGPNLGVGDCAELADLGAMIELCALTCIGALATRPVADLAGAARLIGTARCTLASDYGQSVNDPPAEGLQRFADALVTEGVPGTDIRTMVVANPAALVAT